ncbi:MAG: dTDP-glucose 4,6-dehydratase [Rhabdochlamydiaceae bacterium]
MKILVTGGMGFIGSHFIRRVLCYPDIQILNLDNLVNSKRSTLSDLEMGNNSSYQWLYQDINDPAFGLYTLMTKFQPNCIIHFAAEAHVDVSIISPAKFIQTNVVGTHNLLQAALLYKNNITNDFMFIHVSTDEVYGSLALDSVDCWNEDSSYDPHSPYAASKAASDHIVQAYHDTYGLNTIITHCCNNYGSHQTIDKFIPKAIIYLMQGKKVPIYAQGENIREWIHVEDHCEALWHLIKYPYWSLGAKYNIGSGYELSNKALVNIMGVLIDRKEEELYEFVEDRPGHDLRYFLDSTKMRSLGWKPKIDFIDGLRDTINWYNNHKEWWGWE